MADPNDTNANPAADPAKPAPTQPPAAPAVDVQAEIQKALAAQEAEHAKLLKEATGHDSLKSFQDAQLAAQGKTQELLDQRTQENADLQKKLDAQTISNELMRYAGNAVDPETVQELLRGKAVVKDGVVTINGQPVQTAVDSLLKEKPFLAKPSGNAGSGAPAGGAAGAKNPWSQAHFNLTEQSRITLENPQEAEKLKAAAGA